LNALTLPGRPAHTRKNRSAGLRFLLLASLLGWQLLAAQTAARESDVEAAYLFNFGKFMRVASHTGSSFTIGIMGSNPFGGTLEQLTAKESIDGRPMHISRVSNAEEARSCDILFVGESDLSQVDRDLAEVSGAPVLTVSNTPGFVDRGGMIQFVVQQNRVRFRVNLAAVARAHIQLSSELLKVAVSVSGAPGEDRP